MFKKVKRGHPKYIPNNAKTRELDLVLSMMLKAGVLTQDPQDPDNFLFADLPEEELFAKMDQVQEACAKLDQTFN